MSRRAKLAKTETLRGKFVANSVLLGLSDRSRNRVFVKYTNNGSARTIFRCRPHSAGPGVRCFGVRIGNLGNKRSNNRVRGKLNGTGGVLIHCLCLLGGRTSFGLYFVRNNGLHGTVTHRTRTAVNLCPRRGRTTHVLLGRFATSVRGRLGRMSPGMRVAVTSASHPSGCVDSCSTRGLVLTLRTYPRNIVNVDRSVRKLIRASAGLTSIGVKSSDAVVINADRHDSVRSYGGVVTGRITSIFGLTNTRMARNSNCPN